MPWYAAHSPFSPRPNIGTSTPRASDEPARPSAVSVRDSAGDQRDHDLHGEQRRACGHAPVPASAARSAGTPGDADLLLAAALHDVPERPQEREHADANSDIAVIARHPLRRRGEHDRRSRGGDRERRRADGLARMITSPACAGVLDGASRVARSSSSSNTPSVSPSRRRQHVVGEFLARRGDATRVPSRPRRVGSSSSAANASAAACTSSGSSTTKPVTPSTTASAAPPDAPATWGTPHAAASTNTMPNPSCSRPPQRLRHSIVNRSAQPYRRGQVVVRDPPEEPDRRIEFGRQPPQAVVVAATAGDHRAADRAAPGRAAPQRGSPCRSPCAARAGEMPTISSASSGMPKWRRAASRSASVSGRNRSASTPQRHDRDRQLAPGGLLGLGRRVPAGGDDVAGAPERVRRAPACSAGAGPGTVTSAPCSTRSYGSCSDGPIRPSGTAGSSTTRSAPKSRARSLTCAHHPRVRQQHRLAGALDPERLLGVERRGAGVRAGEHGEPVGGRRRHHSHSNDWMPPILGGKSFVTSRCFIRSAVSSGGGSVRCGVGRAARGGELELPLRPVGVFGEDRIGTANGSGRAPRGTRGSSGSRNVADHHQGVAPHPSIVTIGDVPVGVPLLDPFVVGVEQIERRRPTARTEVVDVATVLRRPSRTVIGQTSWQSSHP